jgi:phage tail protein X
MKILRFTLSVILMSLSTMAFAQSDAQKSTDKPAPSEAQKSFIQLKTLAGSWQGPVTVVPPQQDLKDGEQIWVSLRVTSRGNTLVHEITPDDPTQDDPITMLYLDGDRLLLTHYCDAGNRPRMVARTSPDGKTVEFDFLDVAGGTQYGHMHHAVFTIVEANHHIEDWTYMMPGDKPLHAHIDLKRAQ